MDATAPRASRPSAAPPAGGGRALEFPILHRSYCAATYGPMTISLWDGAPRRERIERTVRVARDQCDRNPDGGGFALLIEPNTGMPELDVRSLVSDALQEMARFIHAAAVVAPVDGFVAATSRSVVNLLFVAARAPFPVRMFASVGEATRWQCDRLRIEPAIEPRELGRVLGEVRKRHAEHRALAERADL